MEFESRTINLKDGRTCVLRPTHPDDAEQMIDYLTEMAIHLSYEQMDLEVVADNTRAQVLYQKCGFTETGGRARALKFDDGTYHDELLMVKILR